MTMIGQTLTHYRIVEKIGAGGMGVVYRAHDERLDRDVAIKVLPTGALVDDRTRKRFRKEALALSKLNHPNIATVHDFDTQEDVDFLVMEYVEGATLAEKIRTGPLDEKEITRVGIQIAAALEEAHERGIVHRDLKPGNIVVTSKGRVKVLDFGLARMLRPVSDEASTEARTEGLAVVGTLPYMAPEQLRGERSDHRSDLYSFGVMLYEMASGRRPFEQKPPAALLGAILNAPPESPAVHHRSVSPALESIILKALDKDPARRYQSAREIRVDLERLGSPASTVAVQRKPVPAARWLWGLGGVALVLAALLLWNVGLKDRLRGNPAPGPIQSLAVLPLANLSGDPDQEYFADGMTDELITTLSKIGVLDVISRTSVMRYKGSDKPLPQIASELGVDAIVEGSVLRSETEVRITVQLIDGASDRHLWAESYERPLRDVLKLQGDVARAVAREIDLALTPQEERRLRGAPVDPEAYEAYLKGVHYFMSFTAGGMRKGIEYLEKAIARDPEYAPAYAALAAVHLNSTYFLSLPQTETLPTARKLMETALELDPESETALLSQAWIEVTYEWDWEAAERIHRLCLKLHPGSAFGHHNYGYMLGCLGRFEEAVSHGRRAEQLDPLSPNIGQTLGMVLYFARRYDEAIAQLEKTIELEPNFWLTYQRLGLVLLATGQYGRGREVVKKAMSLAGPGTLRNGKPLYAQLLAASGRREEAVAILRELEQIERRRYLPPCDIARVHVALGNTDEAFRWLEKAIEVKDGDLFMLKAWPVWDPLRSDPRFDALLRRLKFPE